MKIIPFRYRKKYRSDEELLGEYLNSGNTEAMGELYSRYLHLVLGVCLKYLKEMETSKDHVILIYEKIQDEVHRHDIRNFKSWLFVVTKNHCLMELRKKKVVGTTVTGDEKELAFFMEKEADLHPLDMDESVRDRALHECLEKLNEAQRQCILRFYFEGKCYREIAGLLHADEKTVKSHIQNGKRNLKICLEKKNGEKQGKY